ncbi:MAG: SPOR domain-containing protein [bacterium]|nr:SPOR domain-containing protein [Candidatus Limimorpha equi]
MLTIAESISDLLFQNDFVIVPGLGAFVREMGSANVNVITHQFCQPSANIAFDANRREDNDLLASYLSSVNNVPIEEARKLVLIFVNDCFSNLKTGKTVDLPGLGTLSFNAMQEIDFEQDKSVNRNPDAFGLCDFTAVPVFQSKTKEEIKTEIEQQQKDKNTPMTVDRKEVHKDDEKPKRHLAWLWILLSILALAAAIFLLNYFRIIKIDFNRWFGNEEPITVAVDTTKPIEKPAVLDTVVADTLSVTDNIVNDTVDVLPDTVPTQIEQLQELPTETQTVAETPAEEARIFIVGGCFSSEENATRLANSLKDRGYESAFVKQRGKLWDVYYGKYQTMEEAKLALKEIKENSDSKAWIMVAK